MSCTSCSSSIDGLPLGCKSNGACASGSCDKMNVFDWLANMSLPNGQKPFNIAEIRFKNGRKGFYKNTKELQLCIGDIVAVESSPGHDIGVVSLTGELVKVQMRKKKVAVTNEEISQIYRKASEKDIEIWTIARNKEKEVQKKIKAYYQQVRVENEIVRC